jgi:2-keto-3-deoxy-L-fuconate dehydrogenase
MLGRLAGKRTVITGAAAGIGRATAVRFRSEGAEVWALDRDESGLASLDGEGATRVAIDVTDPGPIVELAHRVGGVDVLVNCAGVVHHGTDCTEAEWAEALDVKVGSMFRMIKAPLPGVLERGRGSIVNVASVASNLEGVPHRFACSAWKAAVIGSTKAVAADFVDIRVNAVAPGTIDTPSWRVRASQVTTRMPPGQRSWRGGGRVGTPEEVAALTLHLAPGGDHRRCRRRRRGDDPVTPRGRLDA